MTFENRLGFLNQILSLCWLGDSAPKGGKTWRLFGSGPESLVFVDDGNERFDEIVDKLLDSDRTVKDTLSKSSLMDMLIPYLREQKKSGKEFTRSEAEAFWNSVLNLPEEEYHVLREVHGVTMSENSGPVHLGSLIVYDWARHKDLITDQASAWGAETHGALVECRVRARDTDKALELADILFSRLELLIRFMIGHRTDRFDVGILNHRTPYYRKHFVFGRRNTSTGRFRSGPFENVPLDAAFFANPNPEFARLLGLIDRKNNGLENRILRGAEWVGQAIAEHSPASAFVKAAIALEVLLSVNEKGVITPSVMAQISESCAHILGGTANSRFETEKTVKRLYGIRSSVVHSGTDTVFNTDLNLFIAIARSVAMKLLGDEAYRDIHSVEQLHEALRRKRYEGAKP